jgi:predicted Zn-dependent peptidase
MPSRARLVLAFSLGLVLTMTRVEGRTAPAPLNLPHELHRLKNGLTVILHHDARLPRVVVNILYHVGARNDPRHRTGIAHLFEHLMFMGTKRVGEGKIDLLMEQVGGSNNAFTSEDVTDYFDVGPSRLLETLLWVEADRMATLADALTRKKLDLQRDVVLNERRQSYENAPYGVAYLNLPGLLFPAGHPYSWPVIGASEHLRAVTVTDGKQLFRRFYSPRNAALVVAGRFDPVKARELVRRYFEWIPAAPALRQQRPPPPALKDEVRRAYKDKVELAKIFFAWHSPPHFAPGDAELDLAAALLSHGKESRLYRALVYDKRLALDVEAQQESRQLGSQFVVEVTARAGVDPAKVEGATQAVLDDFVAQPPTAREVERARNLYETHFISRLERLSRRAELLNLYYAAVGQPDHVEQDLARYRKATPAAIHRWAKRVLHPRRRVVLTVVPSEKGE